MRGIDKITKFLVDNAPAIFTGLAATGSVATTILAVKATPKALDKIDQAYLEKGEALTKKEVVKATWKCYIPTAVSGGATIACIFLANRAHIKKETALAAMAGFFEQRYFDYKDKVVEITDEETDRAIESALAKDKMEGNKPPKYLSRYAEDDGSFLCYEPYTEQYFLANKSQIMWAEMTANKILQMEEQVALNQILKLFPGVVTDKPIGDKMGWWLDESYYEFIGYNWGFYGKPWLDITPSFETVDGQEVMVIHFSIAPTHEEAWEADANGSYPDEQAKEHMKAISSKYIPAVDTPLTKPQK